MADTGEVVIIGKDGAEHVFPEGFDPKKAAAIVAGTGEAPKAAVERQSSMGAIPIAAAGALMPVAANVATHVATSPSAPYIGAQIGRVIGGTGPVLSSAAKAWNGDLVGAAHDLVYTAPGVWGGGKAGWFTGKLAQRMAAPIASALEKAGPSLSVVGGAAGVGDLAQMAEPNRRDIGFLGVGPTVEPDVAMLTAAVKKGANPTQAAAQLTNGDTRKFAALITAYSQSLGQGRQQSPTQASTQNDPSWLRADGTRKGNGFLGVLQRPDGKVSSEISIGVNIGGKEVEVPTLVPTLSKDEVNWLITNDISDPKKIPMSIQQKAVDFAKQRLAAGKSPFAQAGEGR